MSLRSLLHRAGLADGVVSLRHALGNHAGGTAIGVREALERFPVLDKGEGFACGCRRPDSIGLGIGDIGFAIPELGGTLPAWVSADGPRDHRDRPRTIEGILQRVSITEKDFPLRPWHTSYDWNFFVEVDRQYQYLVSRESQAHHREKLPAGNEHNGRILIECEWENALVPLWAVPQEGSRVWLRGRWILDCGHAGPRGHRSEIHPPKAIVSYRSEAVRFSGNAGPTRAHQAVVYIGRRGGYIDQRINDEDYAFDLHLPPRPHPAAEPRLHVKAMIAPLPVEPQATPFPEADPRMFRVVVPLKGASDSLEEYGAIVSAGWSDPDGTQAAKVARYRVTIERVVSAGAPEPPSDDTWRFFYGINGRWHRVSLTEDATRLDKSVELMLHDEDVVHVSACGFARRKFDAFMGTPSAVARDVVSRPLTDDEVKDAAAKVGKAFAKAVADHGIPTSLGNAPLLRFSRIQPARPATVRELASKNRGRTNQETSGFDYRLEYTVERQ
jgi:hypothetical protein